MICRLPVRCQSICGACSRQDDPEGPRQRNIYGTRGAPRASMPWPPLPHLRRWRQAISRRGPSSLALFSLRSVLSSAAISVLIISISQLKADATRLADENDRLRRINAQMLAALRYSLPVLQAGLPEAVNFDWIREATAKIQGAIAEAERDP
jgi:hypothetical protein